MGADISLSQRKLWVDATKGIGILLVVISHTYGVPYINGYLNACYMPLFFIISGYLYVDKQGACSHKMWQCIKPYISWGCFYLLLGAITSGFDWEQISTWIFGIVYSRFKLYVGDSTYLTKMFPPGFAPLWFLTCMILAYMGAYPLFRLYGWKRLLIIMVYVVISLLFMYCPILMPWSLDTAFLGALFIYVGYLLKNVEISKIRAWGAMFFCCIVYVLLVRFNGGINMSIRDYGDLGGGSLPLFFLIGVLGTMSYATFFVLLENTWICRTFAFLGRYSLTIMCAHMLFANTINQFNDYLVANHVFVPNYIFIPSRLVLILFLCIILSYAQGKIYRYVKKWRTKEV